MGLEDENGPPKKKLKQAQLCFGSVTLKSQKRKLSSDSNDDVHANKIVCKETEKENVEINSTPLCGFGESRKKVEEKKEIDPVSQNSTEKLNLSKSEAVVDLTKDVISPSQNREVEGTVKEDDASLRDFSLVISDSVLNSINNKSGGGESSPSNDILEDEKNKENDSCRNSPSNVDLESDNGKEDPADKTLSLDESLNITLNSEDDDLASSPEDSPKNKSSPGGVSRKLTPKRIESLKRKEERERLRLERIAQRKKAKEEKLKLKQEKEDSRRREKEEKEKKRQAELKIKEEEKRLKEEERKKKEEEKKLKEEERKQKEEERRKKEEAKEEEKKKKEEMTEKEKAAFVNFFIAKKKQQPEAGDKPKESEEEVKFMPFPVKSDMRLASNSRRVMSCEEKANLDSTLSETHEPLNQDLYLKEIKNGARLPLRTEATWPVVSQEEEHDVIIIESTANGECIDLTNGKEINNKKKMKAKLLQFHDNRRPPYWGTWRKKSTFVGPRNPLGLDKKICDYEVDSDSEWEDEGEGEDIDKAGDSDEEPGEEEENQNSGENGYLLDNTFVPHGYLSDEEVHPDEEVDENNPEHIKLRMKLLKQEFDEEMRSKTERLKPRLLGCVWISNGTTEVSSGSLYETLLRFRAVWNEEVGTIDFSGPEIEESPTSLAPTKCKPFPPVVLPVLAKFVHGNNLPLSGLVREFLSIVEKDHPSENITKRAVSLKIKEIAAKTYDSSGKSIWAVNLDLCKEYDLKVINNPTPPSPVVLEKPKESLLVNFLKGVQTPQPVKKRVALIPVPLVDSTPDKKENTPHVATPRPTVQNVFKKRAQLITLSRTPDSTKTVTPVHIDTPRPSHAPSNVETIDLSTDSL